MNRVLAGIVNFYKLAVSPYILPRCRFIPSCSDYALEAVDRHGFGKSVTLIVKRLVRCQPFGGEGWDPVPGSQKIK